MTRIIKFLELLFISSNSYFFTLEWLDFIKEGASDFMKKGTSIPFRFPEGVGRALDLGHCGGPALWHLPASLTERETLLAAPTQFPLWVPGVEMN